MSTIRSALARRAWLLAGLLAGLASCSSKPVPAPPPAEEAVSPPAPAPPSAAPEPGEPTLGGRLADEAAHRVGGVVTAEQAFAALAANGVAVDVTRQYLAATVQARFCLGGHAAEGALAIAVCEYPDAAAASAGRGYSLDKFKAVGGRQLVANRNLVMTVTSPGVGTSPRAAKAIEQAQRAVDSFRSL